MSVSPAAALRDQIARGGLVVAPGIYDPFSARLVESMGFGAVYLGGNALGLHLGVGQPFVTLTETADAVHRIRRVVKAPVIVDAGAGFGDAAHAALAMRTLAHAGAAAVHVDDQVYPKRAHYHRGKGRLAEAGVVADKLRAMREARDRDAGSDGPLLIVRTDALRVLRSPEAALARCTAYVQAGADAVMVLDLGPQDAARFRAAFPELPLVWIGGIAEPVPSTQALQAAGFALALYPFTLFGAVAEAMFATLRPLQAEGRPLRPARPTAQTVADTLALVDMSSYWQIESATTERAAPAPGTSTEN